MQFPSASFGGKHAPNRVEGLDGVRALAATLVIAFHTRLPEAGGGGYIGVGIFFVLSGYLITQLLMAELTRTGTIDYVGFGLRRLARLYPALLLFLVVWAACAPFLFPKAEIWKEALLSGAYVSNISRLFSPYPKFLVHGWSLSVEVQFYLLWPVFLAGLASLSKSRVVWAMAYAYLVLVFWRLGIKYLGGADVTRTYFALDIIAASFVAGGWLACSRLQFSRQTANFAAAASVGVLAFLVQLELPAIRPVNVLVTTVCDVASVVLLAAVLSPGGWANRLFSHPVAARLGLWSYGIYLWHYPIAVYLREDYAGVRAFLMTFAIATALAALSYELYEKHLTRILQGKVKAWRQRRLAMPAVV